MFTVLLIFLIHCILQHIPFLPIGYFSHSVKPLDMGIKEGDKEINKITTKYVKEWI